jgi:hypothetical protein
MDETGASESNQYGWNGNHIFAEKFLQSRETQREIK